MAKMKFAPTEEEVILADGSEIQEACEGAGVPFACTEGVCGTCVIEVKKGLENLSARTQAEDDFLGQGCSNERLACQCRILQGEVTVSF